MADFILHLYTAICVLFLDKGMKVDVSRLDSID